MATYTKLQESETPRYKLAQKGTFATTDIELMAVIIGGTIEKAMGKARNFLTVAGGLIGGGKVGLDELQQEPYNFTEVEAQRIIASFDIGRRRQMECTGNRVRVTCSRDAAKVCIDRLDDHHHEEFIVLAMNQANEIKKVISISNGGMTATVVDPRIILKELITARAAGFIMSHNHPSGNLKPSQADISLTEKMAQAGKLMDMPLLDHIIVGCGGTGYYSFADEGKI